MTGNLHKIKSITSLNSEQRFNYFLRKVTDFESVWGLFNDGWAVVRNDQGEGIPFWPEAEFADLCATDAWVGYSAKEIKLSDFMGKWLPGMNIDNKSAFIFPVHHDKSCLVKPVDLLRLLNEEMRQYE
jgi:Protein of unknown function (DUF2750)